MYRFFVKKDQIKDNTITITGQDVNHIKNVLRIQLKDTIEIGNLNTKQVYVCEIEKLKEDYIQCSIKEEKNDSNESNIYLHVFQGIPKFEKMEWIIEKCTELGASEFTPIMMKRCVVKLDKKTEEKKILRWKKIAEVAAKQSKRDIIPNINFCINIKKLYEILQDYDIVFVAYEKEEKFTLKQAIKQLKEKEQATYRIAIIIGPEGGIEPEEIKQLASNGYKIVSLGKRILRTETAPISMVANIMYELEGEDENGTKE